MDPEKLKQIEDMLAKGMSEDQILAAMAPAPQLPPMAQRPASIGPAPERNHLADGVMRFLTGVVDPITMEPGEVHGTLPLPFTDKRLEPSTAVGLLSGLGSFAQKIPGAANSVMGAISSRMPAARARAANAWLNTNYPERLVQPNRLLPPAGSSGNVTHRPSPEFPRGVIDDLVGTPDLPPGYTDFINAEAFPETAVMGTKPPVQFLDGAEKKRRAVRAAVKPKPKR